MRSSAATTYSLLGGRAGDHVPPGERVAPGSVTSRSNAVMLGRSGSSASPAAETRVSTATTWTSGLAPAGSVGGIRLSGTNAALLVTGQVADGIPMTATLSLVVQDGDGARAALPAGAVELDGLPHELAVAVPPDVQVVAVDTQVAAAGDADDPDLPSEAAFDLDVTFRDATLVPGGRAGDHVPPGSDYVVAALDRIAATDAPEGAHLTLDGTAYLPGLLWSEGTLTALAFEPVDDVPVVVSARLADQIGLAVGDGEDLSHGLTPVHAKVDGIAAYIPSQPRAAALLADVDALSRATLSQGNLDTVTDSWWVGGTMPANAAATLEAEGIGPVTDRAAVAHESAAGPLRAAQRAAAALLVVAAVVLTLVGTALHTTTALEARAVDVSRLRGLGALRRSVLRSVLAEQAVLLGVPVLAGGLLGALACWTIGPLLTVSAQGLRPVPAVAVSWPWQAQVATVLLLLLGCAAVVVPLAARAVRRSTIARLRMEPGA